MEIGNFEKIIVDKKIEQIASSILKEDIRQISRICEQWGENEDEVKGRFIAHATETRCTFSFYMNDSQKELFLNEVYAGLKDKISYEQFRFDTKLALLNEYVEFVEAEEDEGDWYLEHAEAIAQEICEEYEA